MQNPNTTFNAGKPLLTVCQLGRLGDIVATEPAYRFLREQHPTRKLRWYTRPQYVELFQFAPFIDEIVPVSSAEEYLKLKEELPEGTISFEFNFRRPDAPKQKQAVFTSLLHQFTTTAGLEVPDETPRFYFAPEVAMPQLPEKYVVFHCASRGKNRQWPEKQWQRLAKFILSTGQSVVEIGMEPVLSIHTPGFLDMTGQISLQTAARIISGATGFVGVDSGFGHIANATGVFGIIVTGKLRNHPEYIPYSGRYAAGIGCNLVRLYDLPAARVPFPLVREAASRLLAGSPMSGADCDRFCLIHQIKSMRRNPGVRLAELLRKPFDRMKTEWEFFRRKQAGRARKKRSR